MSTIMVEEQSLYGGRSTGTGLATTAHYLIIEYAVRVFKGNKAVTLELEQDLPCQYSQL